MEIFDISVDHVPKDELPLHDTIISLSSTGDVMAMAINTNIVVLGCEIQFHCVQ